MKRIPRVFATLALASIAVSEVAAEPLNRENFVNPPASYRPAITIDEGAGFNAPLKYANDRAINTLRGGGIMFNPQGDPARNKPFDVAGLSKLTVGLKEKYPLHASPWIPRALPGEERFGSYFNDGGAGPGKEEGYGYLTDSWFTVVGEILDEVAAKGLFAIYYDEAGFPSGSADKTIPAEYYRKILGREETSVSTGQPYTLKNSQDEQLQALIAWDTSTGERIDLLTESTIDGNSWTAPHGNWLVQRYFLKTSLARSQQPDYHGTADYLDPQASQWFIDHSYERVYNGLSRHFGSTVQYTFFDDVGIFNDEKTWNSSIDKRFEEITGRPAALYYPALWDDIGPETQAARVGFFRARAELLGETFPKLVTEWAQQRGVKSTGHAPGNYDLQPTATIGDPFKFYAHTDVPTADVLWGIGFARDGFKLISSVSTERDLPLTAAEVFSVTNDANGYRRMIELFVRGFNFFVTGAREPSKPVSTAAEFYEWAGRSSVLLRGGSHVADVAVVFPIESLQAFYSFNALDNTADLPSGTYVYRDADYQAVGEMLLSELHRDFTFIHPETLGSSKTAVSGARLELQNEVNRQSYSAIILPGGEVISVAALTKIRDFWRSGGSVIATSLLPSRSAEFGSDANIKTLVAEIFGDTTEPLAEPFVSKSSTGGKAVFVPDPSAEKLEHVMNMLGVLPDVMFSERASPTSGNGVFGYIHRQRDGLDVYYFGNSSDTPITTDVRLRGKFDKVELWNPHNGSTRQVENVQYDIHDGVEYTRVALSVPAVSSLAIVGRKES